jgi:phosphatidylglycerophosphatase A
MEKSPSSTQFLLSWLATLGPLGYAPAPGTMGSAAALFIGGVITITLGMIPLVIMIIAVTIMAFPAIDAHTSITKTHDASEIIIDEVIGQWLVLLAIPIAASWNGFYLSSLLAAFILFRIFDILKPPPVSLAEDLPGAAGVIADDIMAGVLAGVVIMASFQLYGWINP